MQFRSTKGGMNMSMISLTANSAGLETQASDYSFKTIIAFCCVGLFASFSLMARGVDLSAGLM
jgi:hypothetical protein